MKIQYASDLHLEFHENSRWLKENPLIAAGDVLILAGDIGYLGDDNYSSHPFWDWCAESFRRTVVIPGNHELYKSFDINDLHEGWQLEIRRNVKVCYNCVIPLAPNIDLIVSTLWAMIHPWDEYQTERGVTDFHRIRNGQFRLSAQRFNQEHERCREFIERSVELSNAKHIIVATHHVPSFELMADEFKGSPINGAFTSEHGDFIANSCIEYWIYGHSHRNINKTIGNTRCICNQLGYSFHGEQADFRRDAIIEINDNELQI